MAILLQASNISKSYGTRTVLSNISVQVQERERIGLVGVNGAGKSTLLQIISGEMTYDGGDIFKGKEIRVGYLAQNSGLQSGNTIRNEMLEVFASQIELERELRDMETAMADPAVHKDEKAYEDLMHKYALKSDRFRELGGYEMESRIRSVLHGMGFGDFPPDTVISTLSSGQRTRLALAKMLLQQPDVLLLDEPTNHLDIPTLTWLEDYLRSYPGAILVVSHDRYFLDSLVTIIYEIERHQSKRYTGNYSRYVETKAAEYESRMKQYEKQQEEIARMEDFVQRNIVRASTTKRAQSRRKALEKMERLDKPLGDLKKASFSFEAAVQSGRDVLETSNLAVAYDGKEPLFRNVSFKLSRGETVALIGPNGIGKSSLLKVLTGQMEPVFGTCRWGVNVQIGYYDQEQTGLNPVNTVLDELWNAYPHIEEARIRTVLGNFLFSGEDVFKKIAGLSGGEKARVALSKLMLQNANMLVLDEPTNHLDLFSKEVLEAALMDYEGTLLFISHDRYFLNKMAERIVELRPDGVTGYLGNYDDYLEKKLDLAELEAERAEAGGGRGGSTRGSFGGGNGGGSGGNGSQASDRGGVGGGRSGSAADGNESSRGGAGESRNGSAGKAAGSLHAGSGSTSESSNEGAGSAGSGGSSPAPGGLGADSAKGGGPSVKGSYEADKQAKREERSRQRKLEQLELDIGRLESEIGDLEERLAQPEVYNDYVKVQEINAAIDERKSALQTAYADWEALME